MGIAVFPAPAAGSKTRFLTTLTSGTSYTVPAGVTYLNVTLRGGGGGGGQSFGGNPGQKGHGGQIVSSTFSATAGASITYAIGAGGAANGNAGGSTTMTGATSASGGNGGASNSGTGQSGSISFGADNGGGAGGTGSNGGAGGAGSIDVEYWV